MNETLLKIDELNDIKLNLGDRFCDYSGHHYICDVITEIADNEVDIYYSDLFEWCKHNYEYVEDAVSEDLVDTSKFDVIKAIQAGQFMYNEQLIYDELDDAMLKYCYNYIKYDLKLAEITEEQNDQIIDRCTNVDNNDRLDEFEDFLTKLLTTNEDDEE